MTKKAKSWIEHNCKDGEATLVKQEGEWFTIRGQRQLRFGPNDATWAPLDRKTSGKDRQCPYCLRAVAKCPKYIEERKRAVTADNAPPTHGYEGNNVFCSQRCGFLTALALYKSIPEIEKLLPPKWNVRHRRSV